MHRRDSLKWLLSLGAIAAGRGSSAPLPRPHAWIIRGGRVFTGGTLRDMDLGITPEGRLQLKPGGLGEAKELDARGLVVCPGFIDILADNSHGAFEPFERYKLSDGVTTALQLHGGAANVAAYHADRDRRPHWVHHGVAAKLADIRLLQPTVEARVDQARAGLASGAVALSYSIEYNPAPFEELLRYAKLAAAFDRPFFLHLRYSDKARELAGVDEAIALARQGGARIHIDHLHSTGGTWHMQEALERIRKARDQGLDVTCCVYPYGNWATYLASMRFAPGWQQRFGLDFGDLEVAGTGERLTAATFAKYRRNPAILVAVPERVMPLERTVDVALQEPFCLIGSDGGIDRDVNPNNHPRGAGCFATAIRHLQDIGWPLTRILDVLGERPRRLLRPNLEDRGIIRDGAMADVTLFDPQAIRSPATVAKPNQLSQGIQAVLVGGRLAYTPGRFMGQHGQPVRATPRG